MRKPIGYLERILTLERVKLSLPWIFTLVVNEAQVQQPCTPFGVETFLTKSLCHMWIIKIFYTRVKNFMFDLTFLTFVQNPEKREKCKFCEKCQKSRISGVRGDPGTSHIPPGGVPEPPPDPGPFLKKCIFWHVSCRGPAKMPPKLQEKGPRARNVNF